MFLKKCIVGQRQREDCVEIVRHGNICKLVNYTILSKHIVCNATRVSRKNKAKAGKVTSVIIRFSQQCLEVDTSLHFCIFYLGLVMTAEVARSGQRQVLVPFLNHTT